jgi:esterase/lipase superfamily enzyme
VSTQSHLIGLLLGTEEDWPTAFEHLHGDHLDWLRSTVFVQLCVGTGAWEVHPTQALPSTHALADLLQAKGIPHSLDVWGEDTPHDWPSWARMAALHLGALP